MLALGLGSQLRAAEVDSEGAIDETFKEELDKVSDWHKMSSLEQMACVLQGLPLCLLIEVPAA